MSKILDKYNADFFLETLTGTIILNIFIVTFLVFLLGRIYKIIMAENQKKYVKIIKCFLIVLVFVGIFTYAFISDSQNTKQNESVKEINVPDMRGQNKDEVITYLEEKGINVKIDTEYSDDYSKDMIMKQNKWPNENLMKGDTITLTISLGTEPLKLKDYVSHTFSDIENEVKEIGLSVNVNEQYSSVVKKGTIIKQLPKANEIVYKGDTITFYVSKGDEQARVPSLYGMTKTKAKRELKREGFKVKVEYEYNKMDKGKVFSQNIDADSIVKKGTLITIYISSGLKLSNYENNNNNNENKKTESKKTESKKTESKKTESKKTSSSNKKDKNIVDDSGADVVN